MSGWPRKFFPGSRLALALLLVLVTASALAGCSTPRERYRVLSFFFDGVPNPDAPPKVVAVARPDSEFAPVVTAVVLTVHKPYKEGRCVVCHSSVNGQIQDFARAYDSCVKCHKKVSTEHALMHGPVAREACRFCHAPHDSVQPALLKDTPIKVCTQCHDKQLLGEYPYQHMDGQTSCLLCHAGHGGHARYFLKPPATQPNAPPRIPPSTQPATLPATQPATQSATQPRPGDHAP